MRNQQATDIELGWLAGIIDGEGWLGMTLSKNHRGAPTSIRRTITVKVEMKVNNTDEAIITKTASILKKLGINPSIRILPLYSDKKKAIYEVGTKHMKTIEILINAVRDYLTGNKQKRADLILDFIHLRQSNSGIPDPMHPKSNRYDGSQKHGCRMIKPYSQEEFNIVQRCRELQCRGASETTRQTRNHRVNILRRESSVKI